MSFLNTHVYNVVEIPVINESIGCEPNFDGTRSYKFAALFSDLPSGISNKPNVRFQKMSFRTVLAMKKTLKESPISFKNSNKGLFITCKKVKFDGHTIQLYFPKSENDIYGVCDGGHTYAVIEWFKELNKKDIPNSDKAAVNIEVLVADKLEESELRKIVLARNNTMSVSGKSLLQKTEDGRAIKNLLEELTFGKKIIFKDNEPNKCIEQAWIVKIFNDFSPGTIAFKKNGEARGIDDSKKNYGVVSFSSYLVPKFVKNFGFYQNNLDFYEGLFRLYRLLDDELSVRFASICCKTRRFPGIVYDEDFEDGSVAMDSVKRHSLPIPTVVSLLNAFKAFVVNDQENNVWRWQYDDIDFLFELVKDEFCDYLEKEVFVESNGVADGNSLASNFEKKIGVNSAFMQLQTILDDIDHDIKHAV